MNNIRPSLHAKVHKWMDSVGFRLNASQTNHRNNVTTKHYFFKTFNFFEKSKNDDPQYSQFLCFDTYGETKKVRSLLDLQKEFFENISQL